MFHGVAGQLKAGCCFVAQALRRHREASSAFTHPPSLLSSSGPICSKQKAVVLAAIQHIVYT